MPLKKILLHATMLYNDFREIGGADYLVYTEPGIISHCRPEFYFGKPGEHQKTNCLSVATSLQPYTSSLFSSFSFLGRWFASQRKQAQVILNVSPVSSALAYVAQGKWKLLKIDCILITGVTEMLWFLQALERHKFDWRLTYFQGFVTHTNIWLNYKPLKIPISSCMI